MKQVFQTEPFKPLELGAVIPECPSVAEAEVPRLRNLFAESEERFHILFEMHPFPLWIAERTSGKILVVNQASEKLCGYSQAEFLDLSVHDLLRTSAHVSGAHYDHHELEFPRLPVSLLRLKDGKHIFAEVNSQHLLYHGVETELYVLHDVSERWHIEKALIEADRKYQRIYENAVEGIYQNNPQGRFVTVNPAFAKMLGYDSAEELCRLVDVERDLYVQPEQRRHFRNLLAREKQARGLEFEAYRKDRTRIWLSVNVRVVHDDQGKVMYYEGTAEDVTRRKKTEAQLKLLNETLEKRAAELARSRADLQQFTYAASHDLQEPLRMVSSYLSLISMRYRGKLDREADEFIEYAVDGSKRMKHLIDDLLTYSRVGSGELIQSEISSEEVLGQVLRHMGVSLEEARVSVTHDPLPTISGVRSQVYHLFHHLVGNAVKFRKTGTPAKIHLGAKLLGEFWQFSVSDNGIGLDMEFSDRIFRMFQRLHGKQEFSGTGVGLAICRKVVESQGGKIWVVSRPGEGSTFYFTIPKNA